MSTFCSSVNFIFMFKFRKQPKIIAGKLAWVIYATLTGTFGLSDKEYWTEHFLFAYCVRSKLRYRAIEKWCMFLFKNILKSKTSANHSKIITSSVTEFLLFCRMSLPTHDINNRHKWRITGEFDAGYSGLTFPTDAVLRHDETIFMIEPVPERFCETIPVTWRIRVNLDGVSIQVFLETNEDRSSIVSLNSVMSEWFPAHIVLVTCGCHGGAFWVCTKVWLCFELWNDVSHTVYLNLKQLLSEF